MKRTDGSVSPQSQSAILSFLQTYRWRIADLAIGIVALYFAGVLRERLPLGTRLPEARSFLGLAVYLWQAVAWAAVFHWFSIYGQGPLAGRWQRYGRLAFAAAVATVALLAAVYLTYQVVPRLLLLYFLIIDIALLVGARYGGGEIARWLGLERERRYAIVGTDPEAFHLASAVRRLESTGLRLAGLITAEASPAAGEPAVGGTYKVLGSAADLGHIVSEQQLDAVVIALPFYDRKRLINLVGELQHLAVEVSIVPDSLDLALRWPASAVGGVPVAGVAPMGISPAERTLKRAFDVVVAGTAAILLSPLMLAIALAVKLDSAGPALFRQMRVGERGRLFSMYKFRSMVLGADAKIETVVKATVDGKPVHKTEHDPRVTRVGRFLRKTSLDELPQLFNVLLGQMSLVGPRPEMPYIVQHYEPWQWARFSVPQGITGWWQINGRSERLMHLHTEDDLYYIQKYSFWLDIGILLRTVTIVAKGSGAF